MSVPPWLEYTPQTFLGAMEAGTSAGQRNRSLDLQASSQDLTARGQSISQSEAADRLRLAYDSLASNERQQNQTAQAKAAQAQAAMELRQAQQQGLQDIREQQMEAKDKELGLRTELGNRAQDLREQQIKNQFDLGQQRADASLQRNTDLLSHWKDLQAAGTTRESRLQDKERRLQTTAQAKLPPDEAATVKAIEAEVSDRRKQMVTSGTDDPLVGYGLKTIQDIYRKHAPQTGTAGDALRSGSTSSTSPFKEGQKIRNKKDGKIYVIVNGEPVPMEGSTEQGTDEE